ncbi:hypothetical protein JCM19240_4355 [Vibrio maritimus]|uniref:Uncharacterized protein n=1 Tax=Vibrio maritimus TaxID=990268 RepID=A0A090T497_9VIBR|nr:hypothetical protein JCM19240_4355 [Vibrio maritimus]
MKKWFNAAMLTVSAVGFSALAFSNMAFATPQKELSERLQLNDGFSATFTQEVTSLMGMW